MCGLCTAPSIEHVAALKIHRGGGESEKERGVCVRERERRSVCVRERKREREVCV